MTALRALACAVLACSPACVGAPAAEEQGASLDGTPTCELPAVGLLESQGCTATLVGERTLLTAAHCFDYESGNIGGRFRVDRCDGSRSYVAVDRARTLGYSITLPIGHADLALVHLAAPLTGVRPLPIATKSPWMLERVTTYGYGCTDVDDEDEGFGTKRKARVRWTASWVTCPGDSGGPWIDDGAIVGTTSWGRRPWVPVTDETGRPVRHRAELLRRMGGFERSTAMTCGDWSAAAGFGFGVCLDDPDVEGAVACTATSDCGHCCDVGPRSSSAFESTCEEWGERADFESPICGAACGGAGPETDDCWHCCDLGP